MTTTPARFVALWRLLLVAALALGAIPTLSAGAAYACSCVGQSDEQRLAGDDFVFKGRVAKKVITTTTRYYDRDEGTVQSSSSEGIYTMKVSSVYKGEVGRRFKVLVRSGGSCGFSMKPTKTYLVFADKQLPSKKATAAERRKLAKQPPLAGACSGTRPIAADSEPAFGPGRPPA